MICIIRQCDTLGLLPNVIDLLVTFNFTFSMSTNLFTLLRKAFLNAKPSVTVCSTPFNTTTSLVSYSLFRFEIIRKSVWSSSMEVAETGQDRFCLFSSVCSTHSVDNCSIKESSISLTRVLILSLADAASVIMFWRTCSEFSIQRRRSSIEMMLRSSGRSLWMWLNLSGLHTNKLALLFWSSSTVYVQLACLFVLLGESVRLINWPRIPSSETCYSLPNMISVSIGLTNHVGQ